MGASQWASILELYYAKTGEYEPEGNATDDEWLLWGRRLEGEIRAELCQRAGVEIMLTGPHLRSLSHRWALATPDSLLTTEEPVEAKNISWGYNPEEWAESIPEKYYLQCQQQILVTGAQRCLFGALLWGSRLIWEWIPRDETTIARIIKAGSEFWRRVEARDPPLSDGHPGARKVLGRLAVVEHDVELFEGDIEQHLIDWRDADTELSRVRKHERAEKAKRDAAMDAIAQRMGSHRRAFTATGWAFRWESVRRNGYTVEPNEYEQFRINAPKAQT